MIVKLAREILGMCFMYAAGAYQAHNELVTGHLTVGNYVVASVLLILGRVIFG